MIVVGSGVRQCEQRDKGDAEGTGLREHVIKSIRVLQVNIPESDERMH